MLAGFVTLMICAMVYFLPTITAASKHRENVGAIFALNLFLGWTLLGWVVALVWALTHNPSEERKRTLTRIAREAEGPKTSYWSDHKRCLEEMERAK